MMYSEVQQSLEEFFQAGWTATDVQFENVPFDSEPLLEYVQMYVLFGVSKKIAIHLPNYRITGQMILDIKIKPSTGTVRALSLAKTAADMMKSAVVVSTAPLIAPTVHLLTPELYKSNQEESGWVKYQVSCPFYYDLES